MAWGTVSVRVALRYDPLRSNPYAGDLCGGFWERLFKKICLVLHSVQLTRVFFQYLNVSPSPVSLHLYAVSPHFPRMNPGVHTIALVLSMLSFLPHPAEPS